MWYRGTKRWGGCISYDTGLRSSAEIVGKVICSHILAFTVVQQEFSRIGGNMVTAVGLPDYSDT